MARMLLRITWQAALTSSVVWAALWLWEALAPGTFTTPIEWWLILILFAVHFLPRALMLLVPRRRGKA